MINPICDLLGIQYPILLGGMLYAGRARLVAAVSEAGAIGILGAGRMAAGELHRELALIRETTDKPFGINIPLRAPHPEILIAAALDASVQIFATSGGSPAGFTDRLKKAGATVIHVVATVRQALHAQTAGVDAVVAEGCDSGGVLGKERVTTLTLVPQVVDAVHLPVIAAGGIADGRGMAAAFALGAVGIQMGTRFLACEECDIAPDYRQAVVMAGDTDTMVVEHASGVALRTLKKNLLQQAAAAVSNRESESARGTETFPRMDLPGHGRSAGQSAGLIHEVLPAREIIRRIMVQAGEVAALQARRLKAEVI